MWSAASSSWCLDWPAMMTCMYPWTVHSDLMKTRYNWHPAALCPTLILSTGDRGTIGESELQNSLHRICKLIYIMLSINFFNSWTWRLFTFLRFPFISLKRPQVSVQVLMMVEIYYSIHLKFYISHCWHVNMRHGLVTLSLLVLQHSCYFLNFSGFST